MQWLKRPKITQRQLTIILVTLIVSLTPLYGLSYIFLIFYIGRKLTYTSILSESYIARFIFSFMLLCVSIMLVATIGWFVQAPIFPIIVILVAYAIHSLLMNYQGSKNSTHQISIVNKDDIVSIILAVVAPAIVLLSFFFPNMPPSSSIQLVTRGYDNIAHLTFMRAVSDQKGFVYGPEDEVHKKTIHGGNAYPQGWHVASSNTVDGFGIRFFQSENPTLSINTYLIISCFWYILTVYLFSRISLHLIRTSFKRFGSFDHYGTFVFANILIQLMLFWGCIALGFSNFLACIAYLLLLVAIFLDNKTTRGVKIGLSALTLVAISQIWLLPLPAVVVAIILYFIDRKSVSTIRKTSTRDKVVLALTILTGLVFSVFQAYVFLKFGELSAEEAINHDGGVFWISQILFGLIMIGSLFYWLTIKTTAVVLRTLYSISAAFLGMLVLLFAYQIFTNEKTTYYFVKFLGLGLGVTGIYFVSAFTLFMCNRDTWKNTKNLFFPISLVSFSIIALAIVGTGQTTAAFNNLFQRYSIIVNPVAAAISDYTHSEDYKNKQQLIILRGSSYAEDNVGTYIANRIQHIPDLCANNVNAQDIPVNERIKALVECADSEQKPLTVITSSDTYGSVKSLDREDIKIINVDN